MKKVILGILILATFFLGGCIRIVRQPSIENMGLVRVIGFDLDPSGKIKTTLAFPGSAPDEMQVYSSLVDVTQEAIWAATMHSDRQISLSHLSVVLFSEEFAREKGLQQIAMNLYRDNRVTDNVYLAIVSDSAEEAITTNYPGRPISTRYIFDLLEPLGEHEFNPFTTLHRFIYSLTNEISDPIMPYLDQSDQHLGMTKLALFKGDKLITVSSSPEVFYLEGLLREKQLAGVKFETDEVDEEGEPIYGAMEFIKSNVKFRSNGDLNAPYFSVDMKLQGRLLYYIGDRHSDDLEDVVYLENQINRHLEANILNLLLKFQELGIDPIEMGEAFRMHHRGEWSKVLWKETLQRVEFDVKVETTLISAGHTR